MTQYANLFSTSFNLGYLESHLDKVLSICQAYSFQLFIESMQNIDTKTKILLTAIELFSTKGFDKTTATLIAAKCDISQASVFYHFKNKMVLFEATLDYIISNNKDVFEHYEHAKNEEPVDKLIRLLEANIRWTYKFPEQAKIIIMLFNFSTWDENFTKLSTRTIENGKNKVLSLLNEISEKRTIKSALDNEKLAMIIQQYINGVIFQILAHKERAKIKSSFKKSITPFIHELIGYN
tara:strand:- start:59464 stop:60174 length:711 start_codon:yes stop_codon:yes gene_type:complete